ncbi:coenzyme F420-0:L-glutamate ligase [Paraburkholderia antibiotica]|uniref:Coenzyme F420-0:L-glutamate ligase n=1 Tax=Paraburkholderia antibiotica TaxID=2728839 RepID=A0A7X9ZY77_9BURK|nr:coenzyme F420-0:L-glutamate ligase [Paraburkholderia antibiotica]NML32874.1 coenzyme F420-0:L-glutamate ligase [Paraburkholderia antibiotica]
MAASSLSLFALSGLPHVQAGDDLCSLLMKSLEQNELRLCDGDVLVLAQKIVSKSEGRSVRLDSVRPSEQAFRFAQETGKDPRLVELVLQESKEVLRHRRDVMIVEHNLGFVMANAGIDMSNVEQANGEVALLLPVDPDGSCAAIRQALKDRLGVDIGVVINDSHGRAWRTGTVGVAIGVSGLPALLDRRGAPDLFNRPLLITEIGLADEIAAAASILMGAADEGTPAVVVRGVPAPRREGNAKELVRPRHMDMFR